MKLSNGCTNRRAVSNFTGFSSAFYKPSIKQSLVALAVAQSLSAGSVQAATINVGGPNGQGCGLSAAILSANEDASIGGCTAGLGDDVIELHRSIIRSTPVAGDPINPIPGDSATAVIRSNITINGNGNTLGRSSNASDEFSLLEVRGDFPTINDLTLNDLTLSGGARSANSNNPSGLNGSGLNAQYANVYLNNVTVENGQGNEDSAAVALSGGNLTISDSSITNNIGDGIYLYSADVDITNNTTISNNGGAGVQISENGGVGAIRVSDSSIENNTNGGINTDPRFFIGSSNLNNLVIENSLISGNGNPDKRQGGGIFVFPDEVTIANSVIDNNVAQRCGGMLFDTNAYLFGPLQGSITISNSTITDNSATLTNPVINIPNPPVNILGTVAGGGGMCLESSSNTFGYGVASHSLNIANSTFSSNVAQGSGGALLFYGSGIRGGNYTCEGYTADTASFTIINSTFSGNSAGISGGGIFINTRALVDRRSPTCFAQPSERQASERTRFLFLENTTIAGNEAGSEGGGVDITQAALEISNSIFTGNTAISDSEISRDEVLDFNGVVPIDLDDPITSIDSILGSADVTNFQAFSAYAPSGTNITATIDGTTPTTFDSIIDPLQDNSGPTLTHALVADSPALDAGDLDTCVNDPVGGLDQRGETRGDDGLCDIGAYEAQANLGGLPSIDIDSVEVSEADASATLTITLSSPQTNRIPVDFQTIDGTANEGLDFTGRLGTMTFAPGQTRKIRIIQIDDDNLAESTEDFSLLLSNTVGATLDNAEGVVTILDDDGVGGLPSISIEPGDHSITERDSGNRARIVYTVTLSSAQTENVTVDFQTVDETAIGSVDYETRSGTMTFEPGQTSKIRAVRVLGDTVPEADETFRLTLSNPSSNAVLNVDDADTIGTIIDDD